MQNIAQAAYGANMAICNEHLLKYSVGLSCLVHIALGGYLILAGFSVTSNLSEFKAFIIPDQYFNAPYSSFIVGLCLFLVSLIGICGIAKEKYALMVMHSGMLGYLVVMGGLVMISTKHENGMIEQDLRNSMALTLPRFRENSPEGDEIYKGWTQMQMHLRCCGVYNFSDWTDAAYRQRFFRNITHPIPMSCCDIQVAGCNDNYILDERNITGNLFKEYIGSISTLMSMLMAWIWRENS